jgi:hypothetical protein
VFPLLFEMNTPGNDGNLPLTRVPPGVAVHTFINWRLQQSRAKLGWGMFAFPRSAHLPVAALAGLAACLTLAADGPGDPLVKARGVWRSQVEKETKSLREQYAENLAKLEKELAAAGDYVGATKARRERLRVVGLSPNPEKTAPVTPSEPAEGAAIELNPAGATLAGGVIFDNASGALTGWKGEGASARWTLPPGLKLGGYEVELTWSCAPDAGGELLLKEERYSLRRGVKPTNGWEDFQTQIIGTLRIIANSRLLEISAAAVKAPELFHLKSIRLLPAAPRK